MKYNNFKPEDAFDASFLIFKSIFVLQMMYVIILCEHIKKEVKKHLISQSFSFSNIIR